MKSINQNAPVKCSKTILINATRQKVWSVVTNINQWDSWQTDITKPILKSELKPGAVFTWKTGGANIQSTLHTVEPYSKFGWSGKGLGMTAVHNWTLKELNGQTEVTVDESMEGLLTSLFKKLFNRNLEKGMTHWLQLLKNQCEL